MNFMKTNDKSGSNQEGKWYDQCMKKHFEDYAIFFKCKNLRHISANCTMKGRFCFNFGEKGHMKVEFPKAKKVILGILPPKPKGRSYQMTLNEAKEESDIASHTFLVNQILVNILFDSRADHSFISHEFGRKLRLSPLRLSTPILVELVGGRNIPFRNRLEVVTIDVYGNEFHQELLPFELSEFDVILSMDWLGENLANIMCRRKMVYITPPERKPFIVYRDKSRVKLRIITMMKAKSCLSNGCLAFLAYVIDAKKEKKAKIDIHVVRDFPEVFIDELPGLPPERLVEFEIDLLP
ncbi:hypothetical protein Lser_V15G23434 [Lactuca serriola]